MDALLWLAVAAVAGYVYGRHQHARPAYGAMVKVLLQTAETTEKLKATTDELKVAKKALEFSRAELVKRQLLRDESDRCRRRLEGIVMDLRPGHAPYCSHGRIHSGIPLGCNCGASEVPQQPLGREPPK